MCYCDKSHHIWRLGLINLISLTRVLPHMYHVLVAVYPPEIASVNPTEQNTYWMTINPFSTTYGPLR